jgi:hypothetical protein
VVAVAKSANTKSHCRAVHTPGVYKLQFVSSDMERLSSRWLKPKYGSGHACAAKRESGMEPGTEALLSTPSHFCCFFFASAAVASSTNSPRSIEVATMVPLGKYG